MSEVLGGQMKVVYYPFSIVELKRLCDNSESTLTPFVHIGIIESDESYDSKEDRWLIEKYESRDFRSINGVPFAEFTPDDKWKPLPKEWSWDTRLFQQGLTPEWEIYNAKCKGLSLKKPADILSLIEEGWWVRKQHGLEIVEEEFDHRKYRLVKKYPHWTATYGEDKSTYTWLSKRSFYGSYDDAMFACEMHIQDYYEAQRQERLIDKELAISWVLGRVPVGYRDAIEVVLHGLPSARDFSLRYYKNKVLWQTPENEWLEVFDCNIN